jgi:hypothetical protein
VQQRNLGSTHINRSPPAFVTGGLANGGAGHREDVSPLAPTGLTPSPSLLGGLKTVSVATNEYSPETLCVNTVREDDAPPTPETLLAIMKEKAQQYQLLNSMYEIEDDEAESDDGSFKEKAEFVSTSYQSLSSTSSCEKLVQDLQRQHFQKPKKKFDSHYVLGKDVFSPSTSDDDSEEADDALDAPPVYHPVQAAALAAGAHPLEAMCLAHEAHEEDVLLVKTRRIGMFVVNDF